MPSLGPSLTSTANFSREGAWTYCNYFSKDFRALDSRRVEMSHPDLVGDQIFGESFEGSGEKPSPGRDEFGPHVFFFTFLNIWKTHETPDSTIRSKL